MLFGFCFVSLFYVIFFFNWVFVQLLFVKVISKWFLSLKLIFVLFFCF